jgi:hypothetical protein
VFVNRGALAHAGSWDELLDRDGVRSYLGALAPR